MLPLQCHNKAYTTMFTTELAEQLISVEKKVSQDGRLLDEYSFEQTCPMNIRMMLMPIEENDYCFLWEISQSSKNIFKFSLHVQEDESKTGLVRVDYNGHHRNPETDNGLLPSKFKPYIGKRFVNTSHIHYHVEGYNSLAWALPIEDVPQIATKFIGNSKIDFVNALLDFTKIINLKTRIIINPQIL